jgi:hypothetical protein
LIQSPVLVFVDDRLLVLGSYLAVVQVESLILCWV